MVTTTDKKHRNIKKEYWPPKLESQGHMARVTQKSGTNFDQQQGPERPKRGGGSGEGSNP
jgi:hypothetical protein